MSSTNNQSRDGPLFEKDVLAVGDWQTRGRQWRVTSAILDRLVRNWQRGHARGLRIPVVWNHSHDARDQIGEVTRLFVVGHRLMARFRVTDRWATRRLGVVSHHASVEVLQDWHDGHGNHYDLMLTHIGIVALPVVTKQSTFRRVQTLFKENDR